MSAGIITNVFALYSTSNCEHFPIINIEKRSEKNGENIS